MSTSLGLARRSLGSRHLFFFSLSASSPMTVVAAGIGAAYATSGMLGVPVALLLVTLTLMVAMVPYVAMVRNTEHPGPLYSHISRGLGPIMGSAAAMVALLAYNGIQVCLYGLVGASLAGLFGGPWWIWALAQWAVVAGVGLLHVRISATVLAFFLAIELVIVLLFILAAFTHQAPGDAVTPLDTGSLFGPGAGAALAMAVACFVGVEAAVAYSVEARSHKAVAKATFWATGSLGVMYVLAAWGLAASIGNDKIIDASRSGGDIALAILGSSYNGLIYVVASLLLITSIFAAQLSFHQTVARYIFAMARDRILPRALAQVRIDQHAGVPVAGSAVQSVIGVVAILWFAFTGLDPVAHMFTLVSIVAAIGITALLSVASLAALMHYRSGRAANEPALIRTVTPLMAMVGMGLICGTIIANLGAISGATSTTWMPLVVAGAAVVGAGVGLRLRSQPDVYDALGAGESEPLAERHPGFRHLEV